MYNIYCNLHRMMNDRGYLCMNNKLLTEKEFEDLIDKNEIFTKDDHKVASYWELESKLRLETINKLYHKYQNTDIHHIIIITKYGVTSIVKDAVSKMEINLRVEIFCLPELSFNIIDHKWVPQHIPLSPEEKKNVLDGYSCKESSLPHILVSDPVVKYYGLKRGTLIKIIRKKETTTPYVTYRVVS